MKNILVALEQARTLATAFNGSLHLLCVVQSPFALPWAPAAPHDELMVLLGQMERDASTYLEGLLAPDERRTYRATLVTRVGKPAAEILEYAGAMPLRSLSWGGTVTEAPPRRPRSGQSRRPLHAKPVVLSCSCQPPDGSTVAPVFTITAEDAL